MKFRYIKLIVIYTMFFAALCHFANYPILKRGINEYTKVDILMNMHHSLNGYNGLTAMVIVNTMPFLLGCYYVLYKEADFRIVRYGTRKAYNRVEIKNMVLTALLFSLCHQVVNWVYVVSKFGKLLPKRQTFMIYIVVAGIIMGLFYIQTGLLYQMVRDWLRSDVAALLVLLGVNFAQFTIIKYYLLHFWIPGRDLFVAFDFLSGGAGFSEIIFTIVRSSLLVVCLYMLSQIIFEKKDLMKYEK